MFIADRQEYLVEGILSFMPELTEDSVAFTRLRLMASEEFIVSGYYIQVDGIVHFYSLNGHLCYLHEQNLMEVLDTSAPVEDGKGFFFVHKGDKDHCYVYSHHFVYL